MLSPDVEIIDIDPNQYSRVFEVLVPQHAPRQGLILFYSGSRLVHTVHTRKGPGIAVSFHGPMHLREIAIDHAVDYVICVERKAVRRLAANAQAGVAMADPFTLQGRAVLQAVQAELGSGVHVWPDPAPFLARIPQSMPRLLRRLLPPDLRLAAAVFDDDGGSLWASLILEVRNREITLISTSDMLEPLDMVGKTREEQESLLLARLSERRGPADVGVFCDRRVLIHLAHHPRPAQALVQMVRRGWVRVSPCPWRYRLALRLLPRLLRGR